MPISLRSVSFASLRQHRWFRPAVRALAGLIALWLITWLAIPPLVKGPLERIASEQLGRTVTVGGIDFEPWSLEFALRDVTVAGANGAPPQLTIGRIYADGELQSLLRLAPVVDAFTIENPVLRITHLGDGRYDVDDIIAKVTAPQSEPEPDQGPARLALYNLALTGGSIDFIDNSVGATHTVRDLALKVPFISTLPSQREVKVEPHLAFALDGSRFDSSAQGTPFAQTGQADAQIRLDGLNLAPYLGYLPANLPVKVLGATLDADVKVAFEQHPRMAGDKLARAIQPQDRDRQVVKGNRVARRAIRPLHRQQENFPPPALPLDLGQGHTHRTLGPGDDILLARAQRQPREQPVERLDPLPRDPPQRLVHVKDHPLARGGQHRQPDPVGAPPARRLAQIVEPPDEGILRHPRGRQPHMAAPRHDILARRPLRRRPFLQTVKHRTGACEQFAKGARQCLRVRRGKTVDRGRILPGHRALTIGRETGRGIVGDKGAKRALQRLAAASVLPGHQPDHQREADQRARHRHQPEARRMQAEPQAPQRCHQPCTQQEHPARRQRAGRAHQRWPRQSGLGHIVPHGRIVCPHCACKGLSRN